MGLPQLDFRVPEATWFKSALAGKFRGMSRFTSMPGLSRFTSMPGLRSTGALAWPYKIAVVAVMALVACGTLVTFGSAGAETASSGELAALPGTDEASPSVEGQVLPPSQALLNADDLLSQLNLTDYSPGDTTLSLSDDDDEDSDEDSDEKTTTSTKKTATTKTPTTKPTTGTANPTTSPTTSAPEPKPTTSSPSPSPTTKPSPSPTQSPTKPPCNDPTGITCALRDGG